MRFKITPEQAKEIRLLYDNLPNMSTIKLAKRFGVSSPTTIHKIVQNKSYHDPDYVPKKQA